MQIRKKINHARETHRNNIFIAGALQFAAISFLMSPLFLKNMSKSLKGTYFLIGLLASGAQVMQAESSRKVSAIKTVFDKYETQGLSNEISSSQKLDDAIDHIKAQENLVDIIESLPDYKRERYMTEYRLFGLLRPQQQQAVMANSVNSTTIKVKKALPVFNRQATELLDTDWMNHDFFYKSSVVTGDEGSGKTQMLAFMAANVMYLSPDVDIRIHSIHYDQDEPWFPGMPSDVEQSLFITDPEECFLDLLNVYSELRRREIDKDRSSHPIIRYTDEFQGLASVLGKEAWAEYIDAMIQIKNRGRKYAYKIGGKDTGIRVIAGTHSLKKGMTGLDSGFFAGSNVICLGDSIKDPSTPFPADFDIKSLVSGLSMAKAQLTGLGMMFPGEPHRDKARPAVVRLGNGNPQIKIIPKSDMTQLKYQCDEANDSVIESEVVEEATNDKVSYAGASQYPGNDYMEKIKSWYRVNSQATDEDLKREFLVLTGKIITDEIVNELRRILDNE